MEILLDSQYLCSFYQEEWYLAMACKSLKKIGTHSFFYKITDPVFHKYLLKIELY